MSREASRPAGAPWQVLPSHVVQALSGFGLELVLCTATSGALLQGGLVLYAWDADLLLRVIHEAPSVRERVERTLVTGLRSMRRGEPRELTKVDWSPANVGVARWPTWPHLLAMPVDGKDWCRPFDQIQFWRDSEESGVFSVFTPGVQDVSIERWEALVGAGLRGGLDREHVRAWIRPLRKLTRRGATLVCEAVKRWHQLLLDREPPVGGVGKLVHPTSGTTYGTADMEVRLCGPLKDLDALAHRVLLVERDLARYKQLSREITALARARPELESAIVKEVSEPMESVCFEFDVGHAEQEAVLALLAMLARLSEEDVALEWIVFG